ncbi:MAG: hypothetical protein IT385_24815 [Deltaproteobacteria bacterium]|nr:hypothetical protein [Deltaproteobacteria bacterium]
MALTAGCTSNPTPHPGQDAARADDAYNGAAESDAAGQDFGPDDDNDGIADCVEVNGMWDGETCNLAPSVDAGDASDGGEVADGEGGDADAGPEAE